MADNLPTVIESKKAVASLNTIAREHGIALTFEAGPSDSVRASISKSVEQEGHKDFEQFRKMMGKDLEINPFLKQDAKGKFIPQLEGRMTQEGIDQFAHNASAIKLYVDGQFKEAGAKLNELSRKTGKPLAEDLQSGTVKFYADAKGAVSARLSAVQAKNLETVLATQPDKTTVLGSDKMDYAKSIITVKAGGMTQDEIEQFNQKSRVMDTAILTGKTSLVVAVKRSLDARDTTVPNLGFQALPAREKTAEIPRK